MFWKGPVFTRNGFRNQTIDLENCEVSDGFDGAADGVVIPLLRNCHTHLGDTLARSEIPDNLSLEQLVGPSGWKHKWLEKNNVENSIIAGMKEVISSGTGLIMDFREGGKEGLKIFDNIEYPGTSILLGRPKDNDNLPGENAGISSLNDVPKAADISSKARERGGLVGIHHSENKRENIERIVFGSIESNFLLINRISSSIFAVHSIPLSVPNPISIPSSIIFSSGGLFPKYSLLLGQTTIEIPAFFTFSKSESEA